MAGISHNAKNSNLPEFGDSVSAGSKAVCGLTEAAAQVTTLLCVSSQYNSLLYSLFSTTLYTTLAGDTLLLIICDWSKTAAVNTHGIQKACGSSKVTVLLVVRLPTWWGCQTPTAPRVRRALWIHPSSPKPTSPFRWPARTWWTQSAPNPRFLFHL